MNFDRIFRRNREDDSDDLSVYKEPPKTSSFASVLFGIFALFVTLLIAAGLFFGGRAVYRALNGSTKDDVSTQDTKKKASDDSTKSEKDTSKSSSGGASGTAGSSQPSSPATPSTGDSVPTATPSTGDTPVQQSLPRTGDEGL